MSRQFGIIVIVIVGALAAGAGSARAEPEAATDASGGQMEDSVEERLAEIQRLLEEGPEHGDDVSHIKGQLVPVGEHNEYSYSFPRWNVSTNPVGWMVGIFGVSVSYGFHEKLAVRGDVNLFEGDGYELNVGVPFYFRQTYQGLFLEPGFMSRREYEFTEIGPQVLVGQHKRWDGGFNAAIAVGAGRNLDSANSYDDIFFNTYLRFGYAF